MDADSIVIVSLNSPKEKMWGRLLSLKTAGVTLQGIDLNAFDDWLRQVMDAQPSVVRMSTAFYPMHRVERIALDEPSGDIPSVEERFSQRVGITVLEYLMIPGRSSSSR
jgi:hypothetical protein